MPANTEKNSFTNHALSDFYKSKSILYIVGIAASQCKKEERNLYEDIKISDFRLEKAFTEGFNGILLDAGREFSKIDSNKKKPKR